MRKLLNGEDGRIGRVLNGAGTAGSVGQRNGLLGRQYEDLAVTDVAVGASFGNTANRLNRLLNEVVVDPNLQNYFAKHVDFVFNAAVGGRLAFLSPVSLSITDGHPLNANVLKCIVDRADFGRLDDGKDQFHGSFALRSLAGIVCYFVGADGLRLRAAGSTASGW